MCHETGGLGGLGCCIEGVQLPGQEKKRRGPLLHPNPTKLCVVKNLRGNRTAAHAHKFFCPVEADFVPRDREAQKGWINLSQFISLNRTSKGKLKLFLR